MIRIFRDYSALCQGAAEEIIGIGKDCTLFAKVSGIVKFERLDKERKRVSVYTPQEAGVPA